MKNSNLDLFVVSEAGGTADKELEQFDILWALTVVCLHVFQFTLPSSYWNMSHEDWEALVFRSLGWQFSRILGADG